MKQVRAIAPGFYNGRRRVNDVFPAEDGAKSKWFVDEPVAAEPPTEKPKAAPKAKAPAPSGDFS